MSSFEDRFNSLNSSQSKNDALESTFIKQPSSQSFEERFQKFSQPKKSKTEKSLRVAGQYGLGILEGSPSGMAYDVAVAPLASKEAQQVPYRENLMQDIERLQEQNYMII